MRKRRTTTSHTAQLRHLGTELCPERVPRMAVRRGMVPQGRHQEVTGFPGTAARTSPEPAPLSVSRASRSESARSSAWVADDDALEEMVVTSMLRRSRHGRMRSKTASSRI